MRVGHRNLLGIVAACLLGAAASAQTTSDAWPDKVVTLEQLQSLTRFELKPPHLVTKGKVTGPAALRVHVDAAGAVVKAALIQSCGNTDLDEAAVLAMRKMRFQPYLQAGTPIEVTLAVPVHVPKRLGRTH